METDKQIGNKTKSIAILVALIINFFLPACIGHVESHKIENKRVDSARQFPRSKSETTDKSFYPGNLDDILMLKQRKFRESLFDQITDWYRHHGDTLETFKTDRIFPPLTESPLV